MKFILKLFDKNIPSVILIFLPYLIFNWVNIYDSIFYSTLNLFYLILVLILFQYFISYLFERKFYKYFLIIIISLFFILIYGLYFVAIFNNLQNKIFNVQLIRGRITITLLGLFFFIIETRLYKKGWFGIQNIFLSIFVVISILFLIPKIGSNNNGKERFRNHYISMQISDTSSKPVLLIITDEYNSPDGLVNFFKDKNLFNFSDGLKKDGWLVKNSFFTNETSTIHSLSSLFNYNLSKNDQYSLMNVNDIGTKKLQRQALCDSLIKKNVNIINFGIFDFGLFKPLTRLFMYPTSFTESVIFNTSGFFIYFNTWGGEFDGLALSYYPMIHNKKILSTLNDTLNSIKKNKTFIYAHLFMPHSPFTFPPEFKYQNITPNNYLAFWKFTNKKLQKLLKEITTENKYRIILSGDHGFRSGGKMINPKYTFAAFYGFSQNDIDKINSVQDLGSLINGCF